MSRYQEDLNNKIMCLSDVALKLGHNNMIRRELSLRPSILHFVDVKQKFLCRCLEVLILGLFWGNVDGRCLRLLPLNGRINPVFHVKAFNQTETTLNGAFV